MPSLPCPTRVTIASLGWSSKGFNMRMPMATMHTPRTTWADVWGFAEKGERWRERERERERKGGREGEQNSSKLCTMLYCIPVQYSIDTEYCNVVLYCNAALHCNVLCYSVLYCIVILYITQLQCYAVLQHCITVLYTPTCTLHVSSECTVHAYLHPPRLK